MKRVPWLVVALAVVLGAAPARVLAEPSAGAVRLYSAVLPGLGHIAAGDATKGLTLMTLYAGSLSLAFATGPWTWEEASSGPFAELNEGTPTSTKLIFGGAAAVAVGTWIYAVVDAPNALGRRVALRPTWTPEGPALALQAWF